MGDRKWENCRSKDVKNQVWHRWEPGLALGSGEQKVVDCWIWASVLEGV